MLRASLLANAEILPQARQESYFFNRIGPKPTSTEKTIMRSACTSRGHLHR